MKSLGFLIGSFSSQESGETGESQNGFGTFETECSTLYGLGVCVVS